MSPISSSEATEGPTTWNSMKLNSPVLTRSKKPTSVNVFSVLNRAPARTSTTLTFTSLVVSVSSTFIWPAAVVMSTTSVRLGWNRFSLPRGNSVSKARAGVPFAAR